MAGVFGYISDGSSFLPLLVFLSEVCVVTLSTVRVICIARGRKLLAPLLGFFEITIWLFAIGQIMQNLSNLGCYLGFAAGFTLGNFLGVVLEQKLALGDVVVHVFTRRNASALVESLKAAQYGVTMLDARGATGPVQVILTVVKRKDLSVVVALIRRFDPKAFHAINDLQAAAAGIFPAPRCYPRGLIPLLSSPPYLDPGPGGVTANPGARHACRTDAGPA